MPYETIIWEQSGGVGRVTLNRPDSLNAWVPRFGQELRSVLEGEAASDSVRAVLITGAGRGFSSGADLRSGFEPADDGLPNLYKELHEHYHPEEEVYEVIGGELEITIDGVAGIARPGIVAIVPANVRHSVKALTDGEAIIVDHPLRGDFG